VEIVERNAYKSVRCTATQLLIYGSCWSLYIYTWRKIFPYLLAILL